MTNENNHSGTVRVASSEEIARCALPKLQSNLVLVGSCSPRPIFYTGSVGLTLNAGARAGKTLRHQSAFPGSANRSFRHDE